MKTYKNMMIKKIIPIITAVTICTSLLTACAAQNESTTGSVETTTIVATQTDGNISSGTGDTEASAAQTGGSIAQINTTVFDGEDVSTVIDSSNTSKIELNGSSIVFEGTGATVKGSKITITSAGTYSISGTLTNGQIVINAGDNAIVKLILNGADITCTTSAPIYIKNAKKTYIELASGMKNHLTDGASYVIDDATANEPNATLFCKSDLTISGSGSLTVDAKYNNAINCKDELKIMGGNITINSVDDGIKGKDCVAIKDANITVTTKGDGIQSSNSEDAAKGYVYISGKTIKITSGQDAIQAETNVTINSGTITIISGGGSANSINSDQNQFGQGYTSSTATTDVSTKGIKAVKNVTVNDGTVSIDSADDAIHSNSLLNINGGTITITAGDDGMHSDTELKINGGTINIKKSYEGIESLKITINAGNINIVSSDDGINGAGGNDSSSVSGRPGQNSFSSSGGASLNISGGYIAVNGNGDGIDINGAITMTAGVVIVNGPTENGNGALDYDSTCKVTGGTIIAAGSSGMALAPDSSSTVNSVKINFASQLMAGTMVHIETADGKSVLTFVPLKNYQSVVLCSSALSKGTVYKIYTGGSSTGTVKNGLYTGAKYSGGTEYADFTVTSTVTNLGSSGGMNGGPGGGMQRP